MKRAVLYLGMLMLSTMLTHPAYAEKDPKESKIKWLTNGTVDFAEIDTLNHSTKFQSRISYFTIIGRPVSKVDSVESIGIQGVYGSQDSQVLNYCLDLAAQMNLKRDGNLGARLRFQVQKDPANPSFAQIQYCTLTHFSDEKE